MKRRMKKTRRHRAKWHEVSNIFYTLVAMCADGFDLSQKILVKACDSRNWGPRLCEAKGQQESRGRW
jgi:hypothetical protein